MAKQSLSNKVMQTDKSPNTPSFPKEGERRNATVLFADISGFTSMSEKMDLKRFPD